MLEIAWSYLESNAFHCVGGYLLHSGQNLSGEGVFFLGVNSIQVTLKFPVRKFVGWLIPPIVVAIFLHCIVGQVNLPFEVMNIELIAARPDVTLGIPVASDHSVEVADHHVMPNVELPTVVQHWPIDVQLQNIGLGGSVRMAVLLRQQTIYFVKFVNDSNTVPTIRQLAGFDNPDVPEFPLA